MDETELTAAMETFVPVWKALSPREQARIPRISRLLALAIRYEGPIRTGVIRD